jgi:uncharacterized protein YjbI with pentapeptide repeats
VVPLKLPQRYNRPIFTSAKVSILALTALIAAIYPDFPARSASPPATQTAPACPATTGTGKNFSGQDLSNHNFHADPPGSLIGANFSKSQLSGAVFAGQDLTNASFQDANLGPARGPVDFTDAVLTNTCFINANLDVADFSYAVISCADFSATSLMKATFGPTQDIRMDSKCRTKFIGATLDVHMITDDFAGKSNWGKSDFTRANFQNLSPSTFNLRGKDISGAILAETNFAGIDMTGANLTDVDFTKTKLITANLDNTALNGATFYNSDAEAATFVCAHGYGSAGGQKLPDGAACAPAPVTSDPQSGVSFTYAGLKSANLTAATLDHATFAGANLNVATLAGASLVQANLQSTITSTGMSGPANVQYAIFTQANFNGAHLDSVDFSGALLTRANFDGVNLNGTIFVEATMPETSFQSAVLQSVQFRSAVLQSAKFNGATISAPADGRGPGADFQCSQLGGADFTNATISGSTFANAAMPAESDCCPTQGTFWCGIVDANEHTYGPVKFPVLNSINTCPNGKPAKCTGAQWSLAPDWIAKCDTTGARRVMWSKPPCDGAPGDIVTFKDTSLKDCILSALPGQTDVFVTTAEQIEEVNCPGRNISDLTGLEAFSGLVKLDLSDNDLSIFFLKFQVKGQDSVSKLRTLDLNNNRLTTLDVTDHPALLSLSASNNQLGSVSLSANASPIVLELSHNKLSSFDLSIQQSLTYVDLSYNQIANVLDDTNKDLSRLQSMGYLDLSHNLLGTIGSIGSLAWNRATGQGGALQALLLACNPTFSCDSLEVYDGKTYPAAASSMCSRYDAPSSKWIPIPVPDCPPG